MPNPTPQRRHPKGTPRISAAQALEQIRALLDGQSWSADTVDAIADIIRQTSRIVRDVEEQS